MGPAPVRRFYLELVRYRAAGGEVLPVEVLARPGLRGALSALGEAAAAAGVEARIAALVELEPTRERAAAAIATTGRLMWECGVRLDIWPQLPDDATRWLNTTTVGVMHAELTALLDAVDAVGRPPSLGLCLDVEPPLGLLHAARGLAASGPMRSRAGHALTLLSALGANVTRAAPGERDFRALAATLASRGLPVHVAVLPSLAGSRAGRWLRHWLLGAPLLDETGAPLLGRPAAMCYASLLRPLVGRQRALERSLLRRAAAAHERRFRARGEEPLAIALGLLSHGVLGDEPVYEDLRHLVEDLEDVLALGYRDVAFFSLEGLLYGPEGVPPDASFAPSRPDWRAWTSSLVR